MAPEAFGRGRPSRLAATRVREGEYNETFMAYRGKGGKGRANPRSVGRGYAETNSTLRENASRISMRVEREHASHAHEATPIERTSRSLLVTAAIVTTRHLAPWSSAQCAHDEDIFVAFDPH